jgi:hypothetical protein
MFSGSYGYQNEVYRIATDVDKLITFWMKYEAIVVLYYLFYENNNPQYFTVVVFLRN